MNILHRYMQTHVVGATCMVTLMITGLQIFLSLITEMKSLGRGGYHALEAFNYVLLSMPHFVYPLFPVAALIGCLIALGRLASQSELIVMRTAGISKTNITLSIMRTTLLMLVVATLIGEGLAPYLKDKASVYKDEAILQEPANPIQQGGWIRDEERFIHIYQVLPNKELRGILQYQFKDKQLVSALTAESAVYENHQWVLKDITETQFHQDSSRVHHEQSRVWPVSFNPDVIGFRALQTAEHNLWDIYRYIQYLQNGGLSASRYEFAFWKRVFQPLVTLVMIGLAIPFIFGPLRTVTMGFRILVGVIVGFGVYTLNEFLGPFSLVYQIPPILAAALPILLFTIVDLWLFLRAP